MVICHKYRYLFIELPQTGSSTIAQELCEFYDGKRILKKHATYRDFLRIATDVERKYFVFSGMRNPMDKILSLYFKYRTDHAKRNLGDRSYSDPSFYKGSNILIAWLMKGQYRYVQNPDITFQDFFRRFYWLPYEDWSCLDHGNIDFVVHFEDIGNEFSEALQKIGITPQRSLPVRNKTSERSRDFWSYYAPHVRRRAQWVFGPYFQKWGYKFPDDWPVYNHRMSGIVFRFVNVFRKFYWRYIR